MQSPKASVLVPDAAAASAAGLFFFHFFRQVGRGELFPDAVALFPGLGHQAQLLDQHLADDQHFFHIGQLFEVRGIGAEIFGSVRSSPEVILKIYMTCLRGSSFEFFVSSWTKGDVRNRASRSSVMARQGKCRQARQASRGR